jgi:uncharacterized protein (TIGR00251 family)
MLYVMSFYKHISEPEQETLRLKKYHVTVRFSTDDMIKVTGDEITVSIKSQPERGRANRELVKKLAAHFGVSAQDVRILSGLASRKKVVEIA